MWDGHEEWTMIPPGTVARLVYMYAKLGMAAHLQVHRRAECRVGHTSAEGKVTCTCGTELETEGAWRAHAEWAVRRRS